MSIILCSGGRVKTGGRYIDNCCCMSVGRSTKVVTMITN